LTSVTFISWLPGQSDLPVNESINLLIPLGFRSQIRGSESFLKEHRMMVYQLLTGNKSRCYIEPRQRV